MTSNILCSISSQNSELRTVCCRVFSFWFFVHEIETLQFFMHIFIHASVIVYLWGNHFTRTTTDWYMMVLGYSVGCDGVVVLLFIKFIWKSGFPLFVFVILPSLPMNAWCHIISHHIILLVADDRLIFHVSWATKRCISLSAPKHPPLISCFPKIRFNFGIRVYISVLCLWLMLTMFTNGYTHVTSNVIILY